MTIKVNENQEPSTPNGLGDKDREVDVSESERLSKHAELTAARYRSFSEVTKMNVVDSLNAPEAGRGDNDGTAEGSLQPVPKSESTGVESKATLKFNPRDEGEVTLINVPRRIWLQTGSAVCDSLEDEVDFSRLSSEDMTWCEDEIEYGDVGYVLANPYDSPLELNKQLREVLEATQQILAEYPDDAGLQIQMKAIGAVLKKAESK